MTSPRFRSWSPVADAVIRQFATDSGTDIDIVGHNRTGKSALAGAIVAHFALDIPIELSDGSLVSPRPERLRGKPVTVACVGEDWRHCGEAMRLVLLTRLTSDKEPLIQPADIQHLIWFDKRAKIPHTVSLHNGSTIEFVPLSVGYAPRQIHAAWYDEKRSECYLRRHVEEMLSHNEGTVLWSRMPLRRPFVEFQLPPPKDLRPPPNVEDPP